MEEVVVYRFFGIKVWTVTRTKKLDPADKESLYQEFATRFNREIAAAIQRAKTP